MVCKDSKWPKLKQWLVSSQIEVSRPKTVSILHVCVFIIIEIHKPGISSIELKIVHFFEYECLIPVVNTIEYNVNINVQKEMNVLLRAFVTASISFLSLHASMHVLLSLRNQGWSWWHAFLLSTNTRTNIHVVRHQYIYI